MNNPTIEQKWRQQIQEVKTEARKLPHSSERDALLKKARQLETALVVVRVTASEMRTALL